MKKMLILAADLMAMVLLAVAAFAKTLRVAHGVPRQV